MNVEKSRVVSVFSTRNFKFLGFALGKGRRDVYVVKSNMVYSGVQTWAHNSQSCDFSVN